MYHSITDGLLVYKHILLDGEMIYFLIFTTIAIVGLFYRIVLAALLLDVFWRFPTLTSVVNVFINIYALGHLETQGIDNACFSTIYDYAILLHTDYV